MEDILNRTLRENPMIAAVKQEEQLPLALSSSSEILFFLCGNIFNLKSMVDEAKQRNKLAFVHLDLVEGFSRDAMALRYMQEFIAPHGIITTKSGLIRNAKEMGLLTVQRVFILDSLSFQTAVKASAYNNPDAIEMMPGVMPGIITKLHNAMATPLIAGGLIHEKEDVIHALSAGAVGVSTTDADLWNM